jgi:cell division protein FtsQ
MAGAVILPLAVQQVDSVLATADQVLPIRQVRVEGGLANLDPTEIRRILEPALRHSYLTVDLRLLESLIGRVAWIDHVQVTRQWPDTLVIVVSEREAVARWGTDGFLSNQGVVFKPDVRRSEFGGLPLLSGPDGHESDMLAMLNGLNAKLADRHLQIARLSLSGRLAWTAVMDDGLEIAYGKQDPLSATDRVLALLPRVGVGSLGSIHRLDLRYSSGFVMVRKQEPMLLPGG